MATSKPDFSTFTQAQDDVLKAKLKAVRAAISHGGEKGRSLEQTVVTLLRDFLPDEYGLSTGFAGAKHASNAILFR